MSEDKTPIDARTVEVTPTDEWTGSPLVYEDDKRHVPPAARPTRGRISVVTRVYYSSPLVEPMVAMDQWSRWGKTDAAAFRRPYCVATGEWQPIDLGWLKEVPIGLILLSNDEGRGTNGVIPTKEEKEDVEKRWLEVCLGPVDYPEIFVLPGTTLPFLPADPTEIRVRSRHKTAKFTVTVLPG